MQNPKRLRTPVELLFFLIFIGGILYVGNMPAKPIPLKQKVADTGTPLAILLLPAQVVDKNNGKKDKKEDNNKQELGMAA